MMYPTRILIAIIFLATHSNLAYTKATAYFSPQDKVQTKLIRAIKSAKEKIYAAVYMITEKNIANALIKAKLERSIDVQIITDKISLESSYGKAGMLATQGVNVFIFNPPASSYNSFLRAHAIMHHKFALFDQTVWTGSFNWTRSAGSKNKENVVTITDDTELHNTYLEQFNSLKKESTPCTLDMAKKGFYRNSLELAHKPTEILGETQNTQPPLQEN